MVFDGWFLRPWTLRVLLSRISLTSYSSSPMMMSGGGGGGCSWFGKARGGVWCEQGFVEDRVDSPSRGELQFVG